MKKNTISWMALRYSSLQKNKTMQLGLAFLFGLIMVIAFVMKNYLLSFAIVFSAILYYNIKKKEGDYIPVEISDEGVSMDNELVTYGTIASFSIDDRDEDVALLILKIKNIHSVKVVIIEPEISVDSVRDSLSKHIQETSVHLSSTQELVNGL